MSILPSHKQGIHYIERCRVMCKDEQVVYLEADSERKTRKFWAIPFGNLNILLLGNGTSITNKAARMLSEEGVMLGFTSGGGTPLFLASQDQYRPNN